MTNRILRPFLFALPVCLLVLPACYTLLKHPKMTAYDYSDAEIKQCRDCHDAEELWYYHEPRGIYVPRGASYDLWFDYYFEPWWYESYWFYPDPHDPETRPLPRRSLRPDAGIDPVAPGEGSIKTGGESRVKTDVKIDSKKKKSDNPPEKQEDKKRSPRPKKKKGQKEKDDG